MFEMCSIPCSFKLIIVCDSEFIAIMYTSSIFSYTMKENYFKECVGLSGPPPRVNTLLLIFATFAERDLKMCILKVTPFFNKKYSNGQGQTSKINKIYKKSCCQGFELTRGLFFRLHQSEKFHQAYQCLGFCLLVLV